MTKVYLGNDQYEIYFTSGTMVVLTSDEITELVDESYNIEEILNELNELKDINKDMIISIEEQGPIIRELEEEIENVSRTSTREKLKLIMEDLDTVGKFI